MMIPSAEPRGCALVDVLRVEMIGTHIFGRAQEGSGLRDRRPTGVRLRRELLDEAKVEYLRDLSAVVIRDEHHVRGFEVAVYDPLSMHGAKAPQDSLRDRDRLLGAERSARRKAVVQRHASKEF